MPPKRKNNRQQNKKLKTESTPQNLCIVCGVDIGDSNPRQLCGKTYCMYKDDYSDLLQEDEKPDSGISSSSVDHKKSSSSDDRKKSSSSDDTNTDRKKSSRSLKIVIKRNPDRIESPEPSDAENKPPKRKITQLRPRNYRGRVATTLRPSGRKMLTKDPSWASSESEWSEESLGEENTESSPDDFIDTDDDFDFIEHDENDEADPENNEEAALAQLITAIKEFQVKTYLDRQYLPDTHEITEESHIDLLNHIKTINQNKIPSMKKILNAPCNVEVKAKAAEYLFRVLNNTPELSEEWIKARNKINKMLNNPNNLTDKTYNEYLSVMKHKNTPTIAEVLRATMSTAKKIELIDLLELADSDVTHPIDAKKYIEKVRRDLYSLKHLDSNLSMLIDSEESKLLDKTNLTATDAFSIEKSIAAKYDTETASKILSEYINGMKLSTDEKYKTIQWAKYITSMPSEIKPFPITSQSPVEEIRNFCANTRQKFDAKIFGMKPVKNYLINYVMHIVSCSAKSNILALCGPPGIGKTTIANSIAECIGLPFVPISIGGQGDACELKGHSRTYVRATPGKIVQGLSGLKYKNAVIFIDEVDKISGRHENELAGVLTHLLDPSANHAFVDDYLGYPIDLSHALFVLAFNDASKINPILRDRMEIMHLKGYSQSEKVAMLENYLLPREAQGIGFNVAPKTTDVTPQKMRTLRVHRSAAEKLVTKSKVKEEGVRQLIRNLRTVLKKINTLVLTQDEKFISSTYDENADIICITAETMETLFEESDETLNKNEPPNSMYV